MRPHLVYYMGQTLNCQPEAFHRPLHSILIGLPGLQGHAETQKPCYSSHMACICLIHFPGLETRPYGASDSRAPENKAYLGHMEE